MIEYKEGLVDTMMVLLDLTEDLDRIKCEFYLDCAGNIICDIRKTPYVENRYKNLQVRIAIELYNKQGVEGQTSHSENGISRSYSSSDISNDLLKQILPRGTTPLTSLDYPTPL